ncbi:RNA polymerase sigma factor [Flavitalea flava]
MDYRKDYKKKYKEDYKERVIPQKINSFEHFAEVYCPTIFLAMSRLTGLTDEDELENLTVNVLVELWEEKDEFYYAAHPGTFLYKIVLHQVILHLEKQGNTDQISILRSLLPIDPGFYLASHKVIRISFAKLTFLQKLKRVWKTF